MIVVYPDYYFFSFSQEHETCNNMFRNNKPTSKSYNEILDELDEEYINEEVLKRF